MLYATGEEQAASVLPRPAYRPPRPQASEAQLREATELLATAKRPLVFSGSGVDRGDANVALLELVDLLNCPMLSSMAGRSSVPLDHSNYIFGFGPSGDVVKQEADVILWWGRGWATSRSRTTSIVVTRPGSSSSRSTWTRATWA